MSEPMTCEECGLSGRPLTYRSEKHGKASVCNMCLRANHPEAFRADGLVDWTAWTGTHSAESREFARRYVAYVTADGFDVASVVARLERLKFETIVQAKTIAGVLDGDRAAWGSQS